MPLGAFDSTVVTVITADAEYALTLVNWAAAQEAPAILSTVRRVGVEDEDYTLYISVPAEANLPETARFVAKAVDDEQYSTAALRAMADESLTDCTVLAVFDLTIYDGDQVIQPDATLSVSVDFGEGLALGAQVFAVHFPGTGEQAPVVEMAAVEKPMSSGKKLLARTTATVQTAAKTSADLRTDVIRAASSEGVVTFPASSFSVYAIVETADTDPSETVSRKYEFYTDNTFGTAYTFVNKEGEESCVQYVTEGGMLYNPDAPAEIVGGKQFVGWADENGTVIIVPGTEGTVITGITGTNTVIMLYPRYDEVYYIEYYDEHHNVYKTESSVNGDFTMNGMKGSLTEDGEYRITYQPDDSEEAFMGWSLEEQSLDTATEVDFTGDADRKIELYPAKAKVFWINFDKNDAGGTSKATYTAPVWVLQSDNKVSDRHASLPGSTRPGYDFGGWYTDPDCTTPFDMNTHLTGDITLYAKWIPADQTYTVVILKQRISDSVTATAEEKTYDYETSYAIHGTTGSTASVPNQYESLNYDGFSYAGCDANATIAADGSTVLYVYYDRKIVTFNFYLYGTTGATINYTTINENQANTHYTNGTNVYGDYQGNKVVLIRTSSITTRYYLSENNYNGAPEYTDTVYELRNGSYIEASKPYDRTRVCF